MGRPCARFVLDTGALIKGLIIEDAATTAEALAEARSRSASDNVEALISRGLRVLAPSQAGLDKAREAARGTGDDAELSATDIGLLALALELRAELVTDDYAVQNTAARLGVQVKTLEQRGISDELVWAYRCSGCRRRYDEELPDCPVCGAKLRKVAKERRKTRLAGEGR